MIDFKKLHNGFLMHQALLTAAAAATQSTGTNTASSIERKIENISYNNNYSVLLIYLI